MLQISWIYYIICVVLAASVIGVLRFYRQGWIKSVAAGLTVSYMFLVLSITVLSRGPTEHPFNYFPPFWAYREIFSGSEIAQSLTIQIIVNIFMLAPLGFLLPFITTRKPILYGILFSLFIEILQYLTKRGYFEIDDIIHNTIGLLIGYGFYQLTTKYFELRRKKDES